MNLKNFFRRTKASVIPPLAVCSAIAAQHGFLQFYVVKIFIADFKAPAISLIHGALWEIFIRFAFSLAVIVVLIAFPKTFLLGLKSPRLLILLAIISSLSFIIPWHREVYKATNFTFHFSLSLILSEFCTVAVATFVTNGLSTLFKTSSHPHMLLLMTEATITASFIVIPLTQILTKNFTNFIIFQEITYFISGFGLFTLIVGSFFWPKKDKQLVSNEQVSKIQKQFSVKFTKAVKNQIKINFGNKSARGTGGNNSSENVESNEITPPQTANPSSENRSPFSLIWSPHFLFPLIGRIFRQSRIVLFLQPAFVFH
uniref:Uncharacterized protein n=1 Tax=Panagrolaimus davidi TaxID=227884 RepID=A0A914P5E3_9BILA